jgi:hypothetical protein
MSWWFKVLLTVVLLPKCVYAVDPAATYEQVAPILKKYCVGCHNPDDHEGELSLESFADIQKGGEHGRVVLPGQSASSRLIRVLSGQSKPRMPPKDEPQPSREDVALLTAWVNAGARGPEGAEPDRSALIVPKIKPATGAKAAITSIEYSPDGKTIAVARFGEVDLLRARDQQSIKKFADLLGKVNSVSFARDGVWLVVATGKAGLIGEARIYDVATGKVVRMFAAHRDALYDAVVDPADNVLATASYDRRIILWDIESGKQLRTISGHNGAVYDLAFSPDGRVLASASGDETVKLWRVETGERLDTLGQPLAEQYAVAFSPDGRYVVAGGADNRIRAWRFVSKEKPQINPLAYARFAHDGAILRLVFHPAKHSLARVTSIADDGTLKLWSQHNFGMLHAYEKQLAIAHAMAVSPDGKITTVGRADGSLAFYDAPGFDLEGLPTTAVKSGPLRFPADPNKQYSEQEPNNSTSQAQVIAVPATVTGTIHAKGDGEDADLFRFELRKKQGFLSAERHWVIEIDAARSKSPLDSKIEVLDADGRPVPRVMLQAVRDSYFTFRGKDSNTIDDFRVHNWQEMKLNEFLYANGEVVKLFQFPRGPDSGFKVYPNTGKRYCFFGTTAISHALHEPCYIVEPIAPLAGEKLVPNGLPVFQVNYENDDDSLRQWGSDSRLLFEAPSAGTYCVRVTDTRGFSGEKYNYTLTVRPQRQDFKVTLHGANPKVPVGSGKKFHVTAERIDGFEGEIRVDINGVPPGIHVTTPLFIERGQLTAHGSIHALPGAPQPMKENASATKVTAKAHLPHRDVVKEVNNLGEIKLEARPPLLATLSPLDSKWSLDAEVSDGGQVELLELTIRPGQTIKARLRIERNGHKGLASFGGAEAGWNLPHGVFVDNIGLNGVLIPEGTSERTVFITAAKSVLPQTRTFFLQSKQSGNQCTWPVVLHVKPDENADL